MAVIESSGRQSGKSFAAELGKAAPSLRSLARVLTRNEELAADLTQETLAKAWAARASFAPGTNLRAWLFTIMRNQFRSEARRAWRQMPWDEHAAERIPGPRLEQIWALELKDAIRAMESLPRHQREAVILAGAGGLSSEDAAAALQCRPTAVKSRVSRARHTMRSMLDGQTPLAPRPREDDAIATLARELARLSAPSVFTEGRA